MIAKSLVANYGNDAAGAARCPYLRGWDLRIAVAVIGAADTCTGRANSSTGATFQLKSGGEAHQCWSFSNNWVRSLNASSFQRGLESRRDHWESLRGADITGSLDACL